MKTLARRIGALTVLFTSLLIVHQAEAFPGVNGDIVYQRFYKGGSEIFSYDPATKKSTRLTSKKIESGDGVSAGNPAYSPNGRKITFINSVKPRSGGPRRNQVFVMRADGSRPRQLTSSKANLGDPAFSADGSRIVFVVGNEVHAIDSDGSNEVNLTAALPGSASTPAFSPDGSRIAISSSNGITLIDPDGSDPLELTPGLAGSEYSPSFSPDGTRIAFVGTGDDFAGSIFVMNVDGTGIVKLAGVDGIEDQDPSFSPDGTQIAYTSRLNDRSALGVFSVPATGGARTELVRASNAPHDPDWGVAGP